MHMAQLMPLPLTAPCFSKIQIGFTFLVPAHLGSPGKRAVKWCVCVCVTAVLETLVINACPVVIGGDFNVRFQLATDPDSRRLSGVLSSFDTVQHVSGSTRRCGNTLDLVMTFAW